MMTLSSTLSLVAGMARCVCSPVALAVSSSPRSWAQGAMSSRLTGQHDHGEVL
jgi:hypothetical protein